MVALVQDRQTPRRSSVDYEFPVEAATKIFGGSIVCLNASGRATKGAVSTTLRAVGMADAQADNSTGAAGDIRVKVRRGCYRFANSTAGDAITLANVGADAYIVDDQTVALTNGSNTRSVAGVIRAVDEGGVWIEFK